MVDLRPLRSTTVGGRRRRRKSEEGFDQTALLGNAAFVAAYRVGTRANLEPGLQDKPEERLMMIVERIIHYSPSSLPQRGGEREGGGIFEEEEEEEGILGEGES